MSSGTVSSAHRIRPARSAALLAVSFLYLWLVVDPSLLYDAYWAAGEFPVFRLDGGFVAGFLARPGGAVECLSALLCQSYYVPWLGACVITVVAALLTLGCRGGFGAIRGSPPGAVHLAPAFLLLALYGAYANPMTEALAALAALWGAAVYVRLPAGRAPVRAVVWLVVVLVVAYLGAGAAVLCALLCGLFEMVRGRAGLGLPQAGAAVAVVGGAAAVVLHTGFVAAYVRLAPPFGHEAASARALLLDCFHLFLPVAGLAMLLEGLHAERLAGRSPEGPAQPARRATGGAALGRLLLIGLAALSLCLSRDGDRAATLRIEHLAQRRMWPELLAYARRIPAGRMDAHDLWNVNWALAHTGRLTSEMFAFPQDPFCLVPNLGRLGGRQEYGRGFAKLAHILFDLGRVNDAQHLACEAWEMLGDRPAILQQLALIHVAKGQLDGARLFLRALKEDPVRRSWARRWLRRLDGGTPEEDERVRRARALMPGVDDAGTSSFTDMLRQLLERNPENRMAFEYLMGEHLLQGDLDGVVRELKWLDGFGQAGIPRHCEEALLLYEEAGGEPPDLMGRQVSAASRRRLQAFRSILPPAAADHSSARHVLARTHGDSYFFYYEFVAEGGAP